MAQPSTHVTSALPGVGFCAVTLPPSSPSITVIEMPERNGYLIAYDRHRWSRDIIERYAHMRLGDYELVQPAPEAGAR